MGIYTGAVEVQTERDWNSPTNSGKTGGFEIEARVSKISIQVDEIIENNEMRQTNYSNVTFKDNQTDRNQFLNFKK